MPSSTSTCSASRTLNLLTAPASNLSDPIDCPDPVELPVGPYALESPVQPKGAPNDEVEVVRDMDEEATDEEDQVLDDDESDTEEVMEVISVVQAQETFQPGSTPMKGTKRYLAYNMIGVIEVTDQTTHHIVNVEFHDRSMRSGYHFTDRFRYDIASLGERGAVYACQPTTTSPAHVLYKPYGTWTSHLDWTYELHGNTRILGVAAGGLPPTKSLRKVMDVDVEGLGNVVIATSDGELIFLTGSGVERACLALPGTFVTMVAGREWVFLVTRDGSTTTDGLQNLVGRLIRFVDFCALQRDSLPVPKNHILKWVGITGEGASLQRFEHVAQALRTYPQVPAIYDSSGVLNVMPHFRASLSAMWMRVLHTGRLEGGTGYDRSYWPVGVIGDTLFCLILKGRQEFPEFPRPLIQELPIRLPFKRMDSQEGRLEEQVARETLLLTIICDSLRDDTSSTQDLAERELAVDRALIQLVQHACRSNHLARALDLTCFLRRASSFDAAVKVASFYHHTALQEVIERLKDEREASNRHSPLVPAMQPLTANTRYLHANAQDTHPPPLSMRFVPKAVRGPPSAGSSAQKRPAHDDHVYPGAKRLAAHESAPSAIGTPRTHLQSNPFLRKPVKKNTESKLPPH